MICLGAFCLWPGRWRGHHSTLGKLTAIVCKSPFLRAKRYTRSHTREAGVLWSKSKSRWRQNNRWHLLFATTVYMYVWSCVQVGEYLQRGAAQAGKVKDRPKVVSGAHGETQSNRVENRYCLVYLSFIWSSCEVTSWKQERFITQLISHYNKWLYSDNRRRMLSESSLTQLRNLHNVQHKADTVSCIKSDIKLPQLTCPTRKSC